MSSIPLFFSVYFGLAFFSEASCTNADVAGWAGTGCSLSFFAAPFFPLFGDLGGEGVLLLLLLPDEARLPFFGVLV